MDNTFRVRNINKIKMEYFIVFILISKEQIACKSTKFLKQNIIKL